MTKPTTAILDGDIIAYRIAFWAETEGIDEIYHRVLTDLEMWTPADVDNIIVAMFCPSDKTTGVISGRLWQHRDSTVVPDACPILSKESMKQTATMESVFDALIG